MTEYTCILCPRGCRLTAEKQTDSLGKETILVSGNACPRGEQYAISEMTNPMRTVTTSVYAEGGEVPVVSAKTSAPVPKRQVGDVLEAAAKLRVKAPIAVGDVLIERVAGTESNLVATRNLERKNV